VCKVNYVSQELKPPAIHFTCLQQDMKDVVKETLRNLRKLTEPYGGTIQFFDKSDATR
jgi:hypothetical protein